MRLNKTLHYKDSVHSGTFVWEETLFSLHLSSVTFVYHFYPGEFWLKQITK